jgi:hypothetical protein
MVATGLTSPATTMNRSNLACHALSIADPSLSPVAHLVQDRMGLVDPGHGRMTLQPILIQINALLSHRTMFALRGIYPPPAQGSASSLLPV